MIVAVVGMCGTGKSEVSRYLHEAYGFGVVYFGGVVLDEVRQRGLPEGQASERRVREELRAVDGPAAIAIRAEQRIREAARSSSVVVDGVYTLPEYDHLRGAFADGLRLLAVHADRETRYERMAARPVRPLTPEGVDERDRAEIGMGKAGPIAVAHHHIVNNGGLAELRQRIDALGWSAP